MWAFLHSRREPCSTSAPYTLKAVLCSCPHLSWWTSAGGRAGMTPALRGLSSRPSLCSPPAEGLTWSGSQLADTRRVPYSMSSPSTSIFLSEHAGHWKYPRSAWALIEGVWRFVPQDGPSTFAITLQRSLSSWKILFSRLCCYGVHDIVQETWVLARKALPDATKEGKQRR